LAYVARGLEFKGFLSKSKIVQREKHLWILHGVQQRICVSQFAEPNLNLLRIRLTAMTHRFVLDESH
jgi:hypothetical protein